MRILTCPSTRYKEAKNCDFLFNQDFLFKGMLSDITLIKQPGIATKKYKRSYNKVINFLFSFNIYYHRSLFPIKTRHKISRISQALNTTMSRRYDKQLVGNP